jgi:hypothetical protein
MVSDYRRFRTAGLAAGAFLVTAAGLAGCGSSGPAALSVGCSGPTLAAPDSSDTYSEPPPNPVAGTPAALGSAHDAALPFVLPDTIDPDNPRYGYKTGQQTWSVSLVSNTASPRAAWTAVLRAPKGVTSPRPSGVAPDTYDGYSIVSGDGVGFESMITAVSATGRQGPACKLPSGETPADFDGDLLPHAGVLILQNPVNSGGTASWLDGYSTSTSQRLWSIPLGQDASFLTDGDTVYAWQDSNADIAAYDGRTGTHLWTAGVSDAGDGTPTGGLLGAFGGRVYEIYAGGPGSWVAALSGASGAIAWKRAVPSDVSSTKDIGVTPVGSNEVLLGNDVNGQELLLSAASGKVLAQAAGSVGAAFDNDALQVCNPGGQLAVAVPDNGSIHVLSADQAYDRTIAIPPGKDTSVAIASTEAYVFPSPSGTGIAGYDLATGKVLWTVPSGSAQPSDTQLSAFDGGFVLTAEPSDLAYG